MSDFQWLAGLQAAEWSTSSGDKRFFSMTLGEFATRSGATRPQAVLAEFRAWAFAQQARQYAVVWTNARDPDDLLLIVQRA